jgi:hypothetical protein
MAITRTTGRGRAPSRTIGSRERITPFSRPLVRIKGESVIVGETLKTASVESCQVERELSPLSLERTFCSPVALMRRALSSPASY